MTASVSFPRWIVLAEEEAANSPDAIVKLLDDHGLVRFASESHQAISGFSPKEIVGKDINSLVAPEDRVTSDLAIQQAVRNTYSIDIKVGHIHSEGTYVMVRRKTWLLGGDDDSRYYIMTRAVPSHRWHTQT